MESRKLSHRISIRSEDKSINAVFELFMAILQQLDWSSLILR
jgi:hypothetical protein